VTKLFTWGGNPRHGLKGKKMLVGEGVGDASQLIDIIKGKKRGLEGGGGKKLKRREILQLSKSQETWGKSAQEREKENLRRDGEGRGILCTHFSVCNDKEDERGGLGTWRWSLKPLT